MSKKGKKGKKGQKKRQQPTVVSKKGKSSISLNTTRGG